MPNNQGTIFIAPSPGDTINVESKPEPPEDLWERLDDALGELAITKPPDNSFTLPAFSARYNCSMEAAQKRVQSLVAKGIVERCGRFGGKSYYRLVSR